MQIWRSIRIITIGIVVSLVGYESYAVLNARQSLEKRFTPFRDGKSILSINRQETIVRVQDPAFLKHSGIEWPSPLTTTTITQSLVKRIYFEEFRPGFQKLEQTLVAWLVVNPNVDKHTQLRAFIETAHFGTKEGKTIIGLQEAAKSWYGISVEALNEDQFLSLVAMLPAPKDYPPGSMKSAERVERIKRLLSGKCSHTEIKSIMLAQCNA